jgi:hypothetical protein
LVGAGVTLAIGPILAVVIVGVVASMALSVIDEQYGITDRVIAGLDEISDGAQSYAEQVKNNLQDKTNDVITSIIDYTIEASQRAAVYFARHQIRKFLSNRPRFY